jgi:hypothetical protein
MLRNDTQIQWTHKFQVYISALYFILSAIGGLLSMNYYSSLPACFDVRGICTTYDPVLLSPLVALLIIPMVVVYNGPGTMSKRYRNKRLLLSILDNSDTNKIDIAGDIQSKLFEESKDQNSVKNLRSKRPLEIEPNYNLRVKFKNFFVSRPLVVAITLDCLFYIVPWLILIFIIQWPPTAFFILLTCTIQVTTCLTFWYVVAEF